MRAGQGSTDPPSRVEFAFDGKGLLHISGQCIGRHPVTWATGQPVLKEVFLQGITRGVIIFFFSRKKGKKKRDRTTPPCAVPHKH